MDKKKVNKSSGSFTSKGSPKALSDGRRQSPRFSRTESSKQKLLPVKLINDNKFSVQINGAVNKESNKQSADKVATENSTTGNETCQKIIASNNINDNESLSDKITISLKNILHCGKKTSNFEAEKEDEILVDTTLSARKPPIKTYSNRRKSIKSDILESFSLPDDPIIPLVCKSIGKDSVESNTKDKSIYRSGDCKSCSLSSDEESLRSKVSLGGVQIEDTLCTGDNDLLKTTNDCIINSNCSTSTNENQMKHAPSVAIVDIVSELKVNEKQKSNKMIGLEDNASSTKLSSHNSSTRVSQRFSEIKTKERNTEVNISQHPRILTRNTSKRTSSSNLDDRKFNKISKDPESEIKELTSTLKLDPNVEANIARMLSSGVNTISNRNGRCLRSKTPGPREYKEKSDRCLRSKTPGPCEYKEKSKVETLEKSISSLMFKKVTQEDQILPKGNDRSVTGKTTDERQFFNKRRSQTEKNLGATGIENNYKDEPVSFEKKCLLLRNRSDKNKKTLIKPRKKLDLIKRSASCELQGRQIENNRNSVKSIKRLKKSKKFKRSKEKFATSIQPRRSIRLSDSFVDSKINTNCSLTEGDENNEKYGVKSQNKLLKENECQNLKQTNEEIIETDYKQICESEDKPIATRLAELSSKEIERDYKENLESEDTPISIRLAELRSAKIGRGDITSVKCEDIPHLEPLDELLSSKNIAKVKRKTRKSGKFDKIEVQRSGKTITRSSSGNINNLHQGIEDATVFCDSPDIIRMGNNKSFSSSTKPENKEISPIKEDDLNFVGIRDISSISSNSLLKIAHTESDNSDRSGNVSNYLETSMSKKSISNACETSNATFHLSAVSIDSQGSDNQHNTSEKLSKVNIPKEETTINASSTNQLHVRKVGRPRKVRDISSNSSNSFINNSTHTESDNNEYNVSNCLETSISKRETFNTCETSNATVHLSTISIDSRGSDDQHNDSEKLLKLSIQEDETSINGSSTNSLLVRKVGRPRKVRDISSNSSNSFINNSTHTESDNNEYNVSNCLETSISKRKTFNTCETSNATVHLSTISIDSRGSDDQHNDSEKLLKLSVQEDETSINGSSTNLIHVRKGGRPRKVSGRVSYRRNYVNATVSTIVNNENVDIENPKNVGNNQDKIVSVHPKEESTSEMRNRLHHKTDQNNMVTSKKLCSSSQKTLKKINSNVTSEHIDVNKDELMKINLLSDDINELELNKTVKDKFDIQHSDSQNRDDCSEIEKSSAIENLYIVNFENSKLKKLRRSLRKTNKSNADQIEIDKPPDNPKITESSSDISNANETNLTGDKAKVSEVFQKFDVASKTGYLTNKVTEASFNLEESILSVNDGCTTTGVVKQTNILNEKSSYINRASRSQRKPIEFSPNNFFNFSECNVNLVQLNNADISQKQLPSVDPKKTENKFNISIDRIILDDNNSGSKNLTKGPSDLLICNEIDSVKTKISESKGETGQVQMSKTTDIPKRVVILEPSQKLNEASEINSDLKLDESSAIEIVSNKLITNKKINTDHKSNNVGKLSKDQQQKELSECFNSIEESSGSRDRLSELKKKTFDNEFCFEEKLNSNQSETATVMGSGAPNTNPDFLQDPLGKEIPGEKLLPLLNNETNSNVNNNEEGSERVTTNILKNSENRRALKVCKLDLQSEDIDDSDNLNQDQSTSCNSFSKAVEESSGKMSSDNCFTENQNLVRKSVLVSEKLRNDKLVQTAGIIKSKKKKKLKKTICTVSSIGSITTDRTWYNIGDLAWAKMGSYCYWPCLVIDSPEIDCLGHTKVIFKKMKEIRLFHIRFFGDRGRRSWIHPKYMLSYTSRDDLTRLAAELRKEGKPAHFLLSGIKGSFAANWKTGVIEADSLIDKSVKDRLKYMEKIVQEQSFSKKGRLNKLVNHKKSHIQNVTDIDKTCSGKKESTISEAADTIDVKSCEKNGTKNKPYKLEAVPTVRHTRYTTVDSSDDAVNGKYRKEKSVVSETENSLAIESQQNQDTENFKFISPTRQQFSKRKRNFTEDKTYNASNKRLKSEQSEIVESDSLSTLNIETKKNYHGITRSGSRKPFSKENEEWSSRTIEENADLNQFQNPVDKKWPSSNFKPVSKQEAENSLQMTMDIQNKLWRRNNLFRGITKEKICQVCLQFDDVIKCKGKCNGWYHVKCITNVFKKQVETMNISIDNNFINPCTSDKSFNNYRNCDEAASSKTIPSVEIVSVKSEHRGLVPSVALSPSIKSLSLLDQIDYKMKEVMSKIDDQLYGYPTDSSTDDFSDIDSVSGSCSNGISEAVMKRPRLSAFQELNSTKAPKKSLKKKVIKHVTADDISFDTVDSDCEAIGEKIQKTKTNELNREFHSAAENEKDNFKCGYCSLNIDPACFICKKVVSKEGSDIRQLCSLYKCGKHYHPECLKAWPQTEWPIVATIKHKESDTNVDVFVCPLHVCHTCVSDDPRGANPRCSSDKLVKCLRCPASYHSKSVCIPAGSEIFSMSQIICPRHLDEDIEGNLIRPSVVINSGWCFICSKGGDLICCETCPASFHVDCLPLSLSDDGSFVCEDCESGRYPLYDEVVWVKLGTFRWWPGLILFPSEAPLRMHNIKHKRGEYVVKFYGTWDHYWVNRGRTFLFQEGDESQVQSTKKWLDCCFNKALEEAAADHNLKRNFKLSLKGAEKVNCLKPPPYIKIKINRPVGNVRSVEFNVSNVTPCDCDPNTSSPCGPDSYCLNRLLLTECNPLVCPAGTKCKNQCFEKREYPPLTPYRTEGRGWGLKTLAPIKKGKFVIEYVGDIINEEEYQRRLKKMQEQMEENYYFLTIDKDRMVDAGPKGNLARFMNHSCQPNCETQKWTVNGDTRVGLFASVDIPAESELTFNYNLECIGKQMKVCQCGAPNCSGFIGVKVKSDESQKKQKPVAENEKRSTVCRVKSKKVKKQQCFVCCKTGDLGVCSKNICKKYFHLECLQIKAWPEGRKWVCPRHFCKICSKHTVRSCVKCIEAYCPSHSQGNVTYHGSLGFVCDNHDPVKQKRSSRVSKNVSNNFTPTTDCGEDLTVPLRKSKKIRRTTSEDKIAGKLSPSVFTSTPKKCSLVRNSSDTDNKNSSHNVNSVNDY